MKELQVRNLRISFKTNNGHVRAVRDISFDLEKGETSIVNANLQKVAMLLDTTTEELVLGYHPIQMNGKKLEDITGTYTSRISVLEN